MLGLRNSGPRKLIPMTENANKIYVGLFMIVSHVLLVVFLISLTFAGGFSMDEMTTAIGFIGPLFAGYTSVIIAYIIKHKNEKSFGDQLLNPVYAVLSFAIPVVFVIMVFALVALKGFNYGISDFGTFKTMIGLAEGAFGLYVGQFIYSMFEGKKPDVDKI